MALKCDFCNKGKVIGRQHTHHPGVAGQRWKKRAPQTVKVFKPNLHMARVVINGVSKRMKLCANCISLLKKKAVKDAKKAKEARSKSPISATASI